MYQYVAFDVDGTLLDSEKVTILSLQKIVRESLSRELSTEEVVAALGAPSTNTLQSLGFPNIELALAQWGEAYREFAGEMRLYDGVPETLRTLKQQGIIMGIVTSKTKQELQDDFVPFGLMDYFSSVICLEDVEKPKPAPDPLRLFFQQTEARPEQVLFVGDSIFDSECAASVGVDFALALWGAKEADSIPVTYRIHSIGDISRILNKLT